MSRAEVGKALGTLETLARAGQDPSHYVARHLLLGLGALLRSEGPENCRGELERARTSGERLGEPWAVAVRAELTLACGEFAQGLDPRYLDLPNYDLEYTRGARERLEDRLVAARALGFDLEPREGEMLALADRVWSARQARGPGAGT